MILTVSDEDKEIAWRSHQEKLFITEFARDMNSLSQTDTVSSIPCLIDKGMVGESISKIKNEKNAGPSGVVSEEMVKAAG